MPHRHHHRNCSLCRNAQIQTIETIILSDRHDEARRIRIQPTTNDASHVDRTGDEVSNYTSQAIAAMIQNIFSISYHYFC